MVSDLITSKIVEGIVVGVSSGIILSLIFWLNRIREAKVSKRQEIERLRQIVVYFRERIYEVEECKGDNKHDSKQRSLFLSMLSSLDLAIKNHSPHLSYSQINGIRSVVDSYSDQPHPLLYSIGMYDKAFDSLEKMEWLKLPKRGK